MSEKDEFIEWLYGLQIFGVKFGLTNITELLKSIGDPQEHLKCIHVAGTDGKGSISASIESILRCAGFRTGLYTSPHLIDFNERVKVCGIDISDTALSGLSSELMVKVKIMSDRGIKCTFFEVTTALAFMYFKRMNVDYAIIEVGMGGRFDATNVIVPEVCVIGNISIEHTEYLGDAIDKIAFEKAGIIKPGVPCVTLNPEPVSSIIEKVAKEKNAPLTKVDPTDIQVVSSGRYSLSFTYKEELYDVSIPGRHQANNASLAIESVSKLKDFDRIRCCVKKGLESVKWPCRMQKLPDFPIIMDVTHTRAGSEDLSNDISEIYGGVLPVFGVLDDKDIEHIVQNLSRVSDRIIVTVPDSERGASIEHVLPVVRKYFENIEIADNVGKAIDLALEKKRPNENILVTGSFYMAGEAMVWLKKTYAKY